MIASQTHALLACARLRDAYAAGAEDGEHPESVEWSDVDDAHRLALEALAEDRAEVTLDLIGTLETLLCALDEGMTPRELLNYINVQVRAVVRNATGRDTSAGHLTLSEELRAACVAGELLASHRELLEICRWKCSPNDEPILPRRKTNHTALLEATNLLAQINNPITSCTPSTVSSPG